MSLVLRNYMQRYYIRLLLLQFAVVKSSKYIYRIVSINNNN